MQTSDFIYYPEIFAPTSGIETVTASCVENATTENGGDPLVICSPGGLWSAPSGKGCQCVSGFVNQGGACTGKWQNPSAVYDIIEKERERVRNNWHP